MDIQNLLNGDLNFQKKKKKNRKIKRLKGY